MRNGTKAAVDVVVLMLVGGLVIVQIPGLLSRAGADGVAVITLFTQGAFLVAVWALLRFRGLPSSHIGLQRVERPRGAFFLGVAIVGFLFAVAFVTEALGFRRDLSNFDGLRGELAYTVFAMLFYGILSAGFYEEILFRGYLMHRTADILGRSNAGWALGISFQAVVFGASHLHQGLYGALYTGILAVALGVAYVVGIRNLWILILAHGAYDALRMLYFHYLLTYRGLETLAN